VQCTNPQPKSGFFRTEPREFSFPSIEIYAIRGVFSQSGMAEWIGGEDSFPLLVEEGRKASLRFARGA
jgi:hypothetical protein